MQFGISIFVYAADMLHLNSTACLQLD